MVGSIVGMGVRVGVGEGEIEGDGVGDGVIVGVGRGVAEGVTSGIGVGTKELLEVAHRRNHKFSNVIAFITAGTNCRYGETKKKEKIKEQLHLHTERHLFL